MSLPSEYTVIFTRRRAEDGVLMGIFVNTVGNYVYSNGDVTTLTDEKYSIPCYYMTLRGVLTHSSAWWQVPDFTMREGVQTSGYYYVYTDRGYRRRSKMVRIHGSPEVWFE